MIMFVFSFDYCNSQEKYTLIIHYTGRVACKPMEQAQALRRTICRLAKEVGKHQERIKVSAMIDLCAQIKASQAGKS